MIRAKKVYFQASKADIDRLFACNRESALVWNKCLKLAKEYDLTHGKWISKSKLQAKTKGRFRIHSQSIQAVCHKYLFARNSAHQSIKKGIQTAHYPYRRKKHYNTKWARQGFTIYPNGKIELSIGIQNGKYQKPILVYTTNLPQGQIKEIELCYDHGLYLFISFEDGKANKEYEKQQSVSVDLGEIRRLQSKCKKGSKQWKKYEKAKCYILSKSAKQLQDSLHKTTKNFVVWCIEQSVSDVYIGNPEGIQCNTRKKKKATKKQAQKLSNWSFGRVKKYLKYKLAQVGIQMHEVNEAYTSQTCPVCKKRKKVSSRNYTCACGYKEHRDLHGARNILSKALYRDIKHFDVSTTWKYLRIA